MTLIKEKDFGTPRVKSDVAVTVEIDGKPIKVPEGTSIMRAAAELDTDIPSLCATDCLESFGSCRLCLVEIEGRRGTPASCTTPAEDGMKVTTQSERLTSLRRGVMDLYLSDHPEENEDGSALPMHDLAKLLGMSESRYGREGHNHLKSIIDDSNPYFSFDASKCILCSRCVRACEEVQGTFALTIEGRGFDSKITAGVHQDFLTSDCVSCGACVQACPTDSLLEKKVIEKGKPDHTVLTTCAYCGVGCGFKAEMKQGDVIRMTPWKDGQANHGHSCVKGRFAWDYAFHEDRITKPMIREKITDPWAEVSWDEAIEFAAQRMKAVQEKYGRKSIGGITSSRCTNEEVFVVQKLIRAAFGNNNVDTCARVCHSPTGYGLKETLGTSAGTQTFDSVMDADVILVIGANPTEAHPVFGSQMKQRLRDGARLIIIDPRAIDLVKTPHVKADYHLPLLPGNNVAVINALAHVIVAEGLEDKAYIKERCEDQAFLAWRDFILEPRNAPENIAPYAGISADELRAAARLYARGGDGDRKGKSAIFYGLGVTEHSQGSTAVMALANLAMLTGNIGFSGVGVNPLRGQNNVQGSCDMGSFPHELPGYRPVSDDQVRGTFEADWGLKLDTEAGYRIPAMFDAAVAGVYRGMYIQGEDVAQSDPNTQHVEAALRNLDCLIVQDLFLNETARFAHVFFPGTSFLEKDGTFTNAERRISMVNKAIDPLAGLDEWEITCRLSRAMGYDMAYDHPSEIMDEIARLTPTFSGVSFDKIKRLGSLQWPCNEEAPEGTPIMHVGGFVRGKGNFVITEFVPTTEKVTPKFPLILTTGRILSQYNVGAQTRRTQNNIWHEQDVLEIHAKDAEDRSIRDGDWVRMQSRMGETTLRAMISDRMQPGVVFTTFHMPESGANVVTTDNSDWATDCPEYKVTAVDVRLTNHPSDWQEEFEKFSEATRHIAE